MQKHTAVKKYYRLNLMMQIKEGSTKGKPFQSFLILLLGIFWRIEFEMRPSGFFQLNIARLTLFDSRDDWHTPECSAHGKCQSLYVYRGAHTSEQYCETFYWKTFFFLHQCK